MLEKTELKKKVFEVAKHLYPCDLPIGVYLVTQDGEFVRCNPRAREILQLPQSGNDVNANINDFYYDPSERIRIMKELEDAEANGKCLEKIVIRFNVHGQKIWVQDYCRSVKDSETDEIIGYAGCLVDVTEEESLRQLFDKLPVGVYKLDAQNKIVRVNKAFADILGYEHPSELEGKQIKELYAYPKEADRFNDLILAKGLVVNERVELLKKNREICYISVSASTKTDVDGKTYIGREGTIQDVTGEENYRQLRDTVPVGTYMVRKNNQGKEVIYQCNQAFADMFEYDMKDIINKEVKDLYASQKDYDDFIKEITDIHKKKEKAKGIPIKTKTSKGRLMTLEVHYRVLADGSGNITGRAGVVLDISNEVALRELRNDIGKTLHFYSAALLTLEQSIKPVLQAIGPAPFESDEPLTVDRVIDALREPSMHLKNALIKMIDIRNTSSERQLAISNEDWDTLENLRYVLDDYRELSPYPEFQVAALHEIPSMILNIYNKMEKGIFPRELARDFFNKTKEMERICCLIRIHQALDTIMEVEFPTRALREYVVFQQRPTESQIVCNISLLIQTTVFQLYPFARQRKVDIVQDYQACQSQVKVDERSVLRAMSNLLYNAIKYSWHREIGKKPWITVKAFTARDEVHVEIQNYGVPIAKEEIENELIFTFGYRGKYSGDRQRMGTGIGLNDARETARKHRGDVKIKSVPASGKNDTDYSQPFLTTVTFILPIYER